MVANEGSMKGAYKFTEKATVPVAPVAAEGIMWVRNDVPNTPQFTDDTATDRLIFTSGTTVFPVSGSVVPIGDFSGYVTSVSGALYSGTVAFSGHVANHSSYVTSVSGALLSGESAMTSGSAVATSAMALATSGFALATSGDAARISGDAALTSSIATKQVSGVYVESGQGTYWVVSGFAQASGMYAVSGCYNVSGVSNIWQASGAYQLSGIGYGDLLSGSVSQYAMSGEMSANAVSGTCAASGAWTGVYQASGVYFQSGAAFYGAGLIMNPASCSIQYGGPNNLEIINVSGYVLIQAMNTITTMTTGKNRDLINASGVTNYYDQNGTSTWERHWVLHVNTPDATPLALQTTPMDDDTAHSIEVNVVAVRDDGSDRAHWKLTALYYRNGGNATQEGATVSISTIKSAGLAAADCVFGVNGGSWTLDVTGIADDVGWTASFTVVEVLKT